MRDVEERGHDKILGAYIRQLRLQAGMSVRALASRARIAPSSISRLEHGTLMVRTTALKRIADALEVDLAECLAQRGIDPWQGTRCPLEVYLRTHFDLPNEAVAECVAAVDRIAHKYQRQLLPPFELPIQNHFGVTDEPVPVVRKLKRSEGGEI